MAGAFGLPLLPKMQIEGWPFPMPDEQEEWAKARKAIYDKASPAMVKFLRDAMREAIQKHQINHDALYYLGEAEQESRHPDWPDDMDLFIAEVAIAIQGAASA